MQVNGQKKEILSFMGPPGAGKGTVAEKWHEDFEYNVLSTGNLCREHVAQETEFGRQLNEYLKRGHLIPDNLINSMVRHWLENACERSSSIILDGFPRTAAQAEDFCSKIGEIAPGFSLRIVLFEITDGAIIGRLAHRLVCSNEDCQKVYASGSDYKEGDACIECGDELHRRYDDDERIIRERLAVYDKNKAEILDFYRKHGVTIEVFNVENLGFNEMFSQFNTIAQRS